MSDEEVPEDVQAAMYLKLKDSVRTLIRKEIVDAFSDPQFVSGIQMDALSLRIANAYDQNFKVAVRRVMKEQMEKY